VAARNAAWLRSLPKLHVLTRDEMEAEIQRRAAALPDMPQRLVAARAHEPRPVKLIRVLCATAGHELKTLTTGDPAHVHQGLTTLAWHFVTDQGRHLMIETDDRAMMLAIDDPGQVVCEISGLDDGDER
jgi:hypothetical protein